MIKKYFNAVKNSRATLFFRASASCSKILNDKKYIFNTVKNSGETLVFRGSASCSKILNDKIYLNTGKNFRATSVFQGKCKLLKNVKSIFNTVKISRATVFQGKRKLLKNPE